MKSINDYNAVYHHAKDVGYQSVLKDAGVQFAKIIDREYPRRKLVFVSVDGSSAMLSAVTKLRLRTPHRAYLTFATKVKSATLHSLSWQAAQLIRNKRAIPIFMDDYHASGTAARYAQTILDKHDLKLGAVMFLDTDKRPAYSCDAWVLQFSTENKYL